MAGDGGQKCFKSERLRKKSPGIAGSISHPVTNWQMLGFGRQWPDSRAYGGLDSNKLAISFNDFYT